MAYIGQGIKNGTFAKLDTSGNTYNGSNVTFALGTQVGSPVQLLVSHDGVIQNPGTDYTLASNGTQITFTTAPASGASIFIMEISGAVGGPMNRDINGEELILDVDGDTSITADTDDQIDIKIAGADDFQFTANTFTAQSGSTIAGQAITATTVVGSGAAQFATMGIGSAKDLGVGLHIKTADAGGGTPGAGRDNLIIEDSGSTGMTIIGGTSNDIGIAMGDSDDVNTGMINYNNTSDKMTFQAGGNANILGITSTEVVINEDSDLVDFRVETDDVTHTLYITENKIGIFESAPEAAQNVSINQGGNDTPILSLKSSDVAHGTTDAAQTDTFLSLGKYASATGGGNITGLSEAATGLFMHGYAPSPSTDQSASGTAVVMTRGNDLSGTGGANVASGGNIFGCQNGGSLRFLVRGDGEIFSDVAANTYDTYDDAQLARAYDLSHGRGVIDSKFDKFVSYNHEHLAELNLVGREKNGTPNNFINVTGMQRLHNGAIWQQYEKHQQLLEAVYDLAKEAVGEEKANAILDKHEVKRLN